MNSSIVILCKNIVEAIFKDVKKLNTLPNSTFPEDWCFSEGEWLLVQDVLGLIDKKSFSLTEIKAYLDSYFYIDSKTLRFIDEGYLIKDDNHEINFSNVKDAVNYINDKGYDFKHWHEVQDASDANSLERCYQWNNTTDGLSAAKSIMAIKKRVEGLRELSQEIRNNSNQEPSQ